jgi:hypothetical protein
LLKSGKAEELEDDDDDDDAQEKVLEVASKS